MGNESVREPVREKIKRIVLRITQNRIISFGLMYGIWGIIKKLFVFILEVLAYIIGGKKGGKSFHDKFSKQWLNQTNQNQKEFRILDEWKNAWNHHGLKDAANNNNSVFFELYVERYHYTSLKKEKNKKNNFRWKNIFLLVLFGCFLFCGLFFYDAYTQNKVEVLQSLISSGILFLLMMMACGIISKWLDIRKYQETWIRHSSLLHMLDYEMLLYIYGMEPYNQIDKEEIFMLRILDVWGKNQEKFKQNMEQKEIEVMDIFKKLKE